MVSVTYYRGAKGGLLRLRYPIRDCSWEAIKKDSNEFRVLWVARTGYEEKVN